jgi:hypothetical protein
MNATGIKEGSKICIIEYNKPPREKIPEDS